MTANTSAIAASDDGSGIRAGSGTAPAHGHPAAPLARNASDLFGLPGGTRPRKGAPPHINTGGLR